MFLPAVGGGDALSYQHPCLLSPCDSLALVPAQNSKDVKELRWGNWATHANQITSHSCGLFQLVSAVFQSFVLLPPLQSKTLKKKKKKRAKQ